MLHFSAGRKLNLVNECTVKLCGIQWRTEGGFGGVQPPPPEIPKALQNRAKLNPIVKMLKIAEFRMPSPQDVRKKAVKF